MTFIYQYITIFGCNIKKNENVITELNNNLRICLNIDFGKCF